MTRNWRLVNTTVKCHVSGGFGSSDFRLRTPDCGRYFMQKGESIVSIALAAVVLLAVLAVQRRWDPADLKDVASSAEDFLLTRGDRRGKFRTSPVTSGSRPSFGRLSRRPLSRRPCAVGFRPGSIVVYDQADHPVFKMDTLEGSKDTWSALYDFNGHHGLSAAGGRGRPSYTRDLSGNGVGDVMVGRYSGGEHCCTVATILELGKGAATPNCTHRWNRWPAL